MVKEFEDVPGHDLALVFDPTGEPGQDFEAAVVLAATVAWEWCQRHGDRLVFWNAGGQAEPVEGVTGPALARKVLEALALVEPGPTAMSITTALKALTPRSASVLIVSVGDSLLVPGVEAALERPAANLSSSRVEELDFLQSGLEG
jgi:uncharacterized protein (DUF58 family)